MSNWWNNLPSGVRHAITAAVTLLVSQLLTAMTAPPTVTVQPAPLVVQSAPGVMTTTAPAPSK